MALPINRSFDEFVIHATVADVAGTTAGWGVSPFKGMIKRIYSVVEGTTNGAPVISFAIDGATAITETITIASGGGAGDVDSVEVTPGALKVVQEGSKISITSDGAGSTTVLGRFYIVCERM